MHLLLWSIQIKHLGEIKAQTPVAVVVIVVIVGVVYSLTICDHDGLWHTQCSTFLSEFRSFRYDACVVLSLGVWRIGNQRSHEAGLEGRLHIHIAVYLKIS